MNANQKIQNLQEILGIPVRPDEYEGDESKYITYTYNDESPSLYGDDDPLEDTAIIQVNLYTPTDFNYMDFKHRIRNYLETLGEVTTIRSWIETFTSKNNLEKKIRHTVLVVNITESREV
ncbi:MAG: hypothetical protein J6I68_15240 [Butyrivibrio sp.]|uniref:hypothetical protein n=1 Tax=Butyrivibrio sp. TaxID=28121 RepID=UPI001B5F7A2B|nr:hypothetical protein [Butyrivibrio sp.]MBP3784599.1 hypothetical protein [Butyrivibrio sp.]